MQNGHKKSQEVTKKQSIEQEQTEVAEKDEIGMERGAGSREHRAWRKAGRVLSAWGGALFPLFASVPTDRA